MSILNLDNPLSQYFIQFMNYEIGLYVYHNKYIYNVHVLKLTTVFINYFDWKYATNKTCINEHLVVSCSGAKTLYSNTKMY